MFVSILEFFLCFFIGKSDIIKRCFYVKMQKYLYSKNLFLTSPLESRLIFQEFPEKQAISAPEAKLPNGEMIANAEETLRTEILYLKKLVIDAERFFHGADFTKFNRDYLPYARPPERKSVPSSISAQNDQSEPLGLADYIEQVSKELPEEPQTAEEALAEFDGWDEEKAKEESFDWEKFELMQELLHNLRFYEMYLKTRDLELKDAGQETEYTISALDLMKDLEKFGNRHKDKNFHLLFATLKERYEGEK